MADAQFPEKLAFLFKPARYKVLHGGRGGAKSWGVARALLLMGAQKKMRWLCAREFQNSIKDSVHRLLSDQVAELGLQDFYEIQKNGIFGKNGTEFGFEGLHHNITNIRSWEGADGVWVEEAHTTSNNSWNVLIPTIRKDGSEIWMTLNPEFEDDATYARFIARPPKSAVVVQVNWRDNPWFPKVLEDERIDLLERDPDAYDHVWEGRCRQWLEGAIYARELRAAYEQKRICAVEFDESLPVYTAWDLGHTDDTAIWWYQVVRNEVHVLEYFGCSGMGLSEYAKQILGHEVEINIVQRDGVPRVECKIGPAVDGLDHRRAYRYATHWLPHDARAKTLAAAGKTIIEQLAAALGIGHMGIVPDVGVEDGIQAARMMFSRCWFDEGGCDAGLKSLRRYQRQLQQDGLSYKKIPFHNWASHAADAWRMLAVAWRHEAPAEERAPVGKTIQTITMDELWEWNDNREFLEARI